MTQPTSRTSTPGARPGFCVPTIVRALAIVGVAGVIGVGHSMARSKPIRLDGSRLRAPADPADQSLSAEGEAKSLLDLLVRGDHLELEDDHDTAELAAGAAEFLSLPVSAETKASHLSEWLLDQPAVADLYIGDDDLAQILTQW